MNTPKETTTKVEPWDGAKPYLTDIYKQYNELIASGAPKQWSGSTVADQSAATKTGQQGVINYASDPYSTFGLAQAQGLTNSVAGGGYFSNTANNALTAGTQYSNPAIGLTQNIVNGINSNYVNPAAAQAAGYGDYTNDALRLQQQQANDLRGASNPVLANLAGVASGATVGKNPYLDQAVSNSTQKIADQLGRVTLPALGGVAASAGRLGSNAFATQLNDANSTAADAMSKTATDMYANQYNTDVANMLSANNQYGNFYNADVTNRMNANAALSNTSNAQQSQRLAGTQLWGNLNDNVQQINNTAAGLKLQGAAQIGSLSDSAQSLRNNAASALWSGQNAQASTQLQAANMAGSQYKDGLLPYQTLMGVGQTQDERSQNILNNLIQRYEQSQQQPLTNLGNFANLLNGGGYSNTKSPVYSNTGGQVLGGLVSLLGLL